MKRFVLVGLMAAMLLALPMTVMAEKEITAEWPSTNEANQNSNAPRRPGQPAPHVKLVDSGPGWVELEFVMPHNYDAVFEVRIDNAKPTDEPHWAAPYYDFLPDDEKVYKPYYVVKNESHREQFKANRMVRVRHAAGAENDFFFDWVEFPVPVSRFSYELPAEIYENEDVTIPVTFTNMGLSYDSVRFEFEKVTGPGDVTFKATDSNNVEYTFTNSGFWGPEGGFSIPDEYEETTDWTLNFTAAGDYTIKFRLININTEEVIVFQGKTVTVLPKTVEETEPEPKPDKPELKPENSKAELPHTDGRPDIFGRIAMFFANIIQAIANYVRG